jgi:hypothetical protein
MREQAQIKPFTNGMRSPVIAPLTRFLIGVPLVLLPTRTDDFFAWTILPPLTAAFLGANYWTSALLALAASRERAWANGRLSISVAVVFAPLTTAATFLHLDKFHLDTFFGWFWVVAYAIYPLMLAVLLWRQLRTPGTDPPRDRELQPWVKAIMGAYAVIMIPLGLALFVAPGTFGTLWPWELTDLTGQVIAAWLLAFGVLGAHALWENDVRRLRSVLVAAPLLGALQLLGLIRFGDDVQWSEPGAYVFLAWVASTLVLGAFGAVSARRGSSAADRPSG